MKSFNVKKEISETIEIPVPSYWKSSRGMIAVLDDADDSHSMVVNIFGGEKKCATIMVLTTTIVLSDRIPESVQIEREEFEIYFNEAKKIQSEYFTQV